MRKLFTLIAVTFSLAAMAEFTTVEINFRTNPYTLSSGTATLVSGSYNDGTHGYYSAVVSLALEAGNYKITVGNCQHSNQPGSLKNADGSATLNLIDANGQTITSFTTPKNCYDNTIEKTTSVWYVAGEDQTVRVVCPQYTPYLKVEQVNEVPGAVTVYTVTFANADGATGVVPAAMINLAEDSVITMPNNFSMYKEGETFSCWTNGSQYFAPGTGYTVKGNVTLTAVYSANTVTLADRTDAVTIRWEFSQSQGVAPINVNGGTTFVVAQAEVAGSEIDVKLPIDATAGKFVNSSNSWTQINPGVIFTIPSAKDAVITYRQYDNGAVTTPEINVTSSDATYTLTAEGTSGQLYYEYIQVVIPAPHPTSGSFNDGSGLSWSFADGTLTITYDGLGTGVLSIPDDILYNDGHPWSDWADEIESIILPEGLTVIGDNAFPECAITSITIPNSVTAIDYWAFWNCPNLETVNFGSGLESLGEAAFSDCAALTSITIPNSVTTIGEVAFEGCSSLASVTLSNNLDSIGEYAFQGCSSLTSITIPESVRIIETAAFTGCTGVKDVYCYPHPANLTWNTDNYVPDFKTDGSTICHVHEADYSDYAHYFGQVNVTFRDNLDNLYGCGGGLTWAYADGALTITYDNKYEGINNGAIISVTPMPWDAYLDEITSISLPEGLTRICISAFEGCSALEGVTIPSTVANIEYDAFRSCSSLSSVIALPTTAPTLGVNAFNGCHANLKITYPCGSTESYEAKWNAYLANLESDCDDPTDIDDVQSDKAQCTKLLRNGQLLIMHNGKFYNALGAEVK